MNYPRSLGVGLIALTIAGIGCSSNDDSNPTSPQAVSQAVGYRYTAYDTNGKIVATGTLTLTFEGSTIAGQREINGDAPETGTGTVSGQKLPDGTVQIKLNPNDAAVVILQGKFEGDAVTGTRLLDTGGPPLNRPIGTFTISLTPVETHWVGSL